VRLGDGDENVEAHEEVDVPPGERLGGADDGITSSLNSNSNSFIIEERYYMTDLMMSDGISLGLEGGRRCLLTPKQRAVHFQRAVSIGSIGLGLF